MQLFIPTLGTKLRLVADWTFQVQNEYRNRRFWEAQTGQPMPVDRGTYPKYEDRTIYLPVTLPAGTILRVDRIYIRQGFAAFDSVTFNLVIDAKTAFNNKGRFWVKLAEANQIQCEVVG